MTWISMEGWSIKRFGQRGVDFMAGMRVYDVSRPAEPRQIGYFEIEGLGLHRIWYDGGVTIVDVHDPARPALLARRNWLGPSTCGSSTFARNAIPPRSPHVGWSI